MHPTRRQFIAQSLSATALACAGCATVTRPGEPLIIDTHQHLWNLERQQLPWLADAAPVLRRSYGDAEYRAATAGLNVRSVYMEVDVATETLDAEAASVLDVAEAGRTSMLAAVIGGRPDSPQFPAYIERYRHRPGFKGVRRVLHSPATPAGYCLRPDFVRGVRLLGGIGRSFDLCMRAPELMDGAALARQCPETRFVVDHCGNPDLKCFRPARPGEEAPRHTADEWKRSIDALAKLPNVIVKISGVAASLTPGGGTADLAPAVNHCLDAFGPDRVVFGGDWPVCLLGASYRQWVNMLREIVAGRPAEHQRKLWSENALRHYGLRV